SILDSALAQSRTLFFQADDLSSFPNDIYLQSANRPETLLVIPISFQSTVDEVIYLESRGMLDSSSATRSFLQLMGLQWKLFSLQIDRNEQLERQAEILDKVRKTRHQEALQKVALETRRTALATFLGVASHDLKAPLSAIGIWACQLPEGPEKQNIQAACSRATGLIHDYLDGMALELGNKIRLDKEKCDLAELVEQEIDHLLDSLECSVRERTRLLWDLDCVIVEADPMRLRQVVGNLIGNALKHCPGGTPINVFTRLDGEEAVLRVDDEGPGIEEAFQTKLFDAFETSAHRNGSGLGLWIVKKVAEAHRGRVGYERRDIGSSFWVRLPVAMS
ncbi:MAG: HAMP domain-containing histidine kinase, partial [Candidatus Eremiobacteraeota bacterium]|nr:HAMP domain-containing histidine kinase [Candidatus Eremiobacteraeota bacterium]